ncbi:S-type anion channel SLAH4-like [Punica granatum]|uniref:Uncharacterized protein n=2 Tax=Punica granatum TaxID=22663 RepID=A0A218XEN5_PUNGR|nr:S-type anion channel SLAH4-like [Punica granatum]OWM83404.1 hypothetical protein CDL15_Pgr012885 [Punica granatum]PKI48867.1 hypothetical protein CRG98_030715 [Punica granatum]
MKEQDHQHPHLQAIVEAHASVACSGHENLNKALINSVSTLSRFHAGYFRITLSLASQALLWKTLVDRSKQFHKLPSLTFLLVWCLALATQVLFCFLYLLKCLFHFHMVRAEFLHHVGVNYLFAPWIGWLLLLQSSPNFFFASNTTPYIALWWVFMIPIIVLDVKIYGQWFTTEKRFLSAAANPTSQVTVIANLVGARAAAQMGWEETAMCMFSLGIIHYLVIFVTLYQRLSGGNNFPAMLRPTFFLFFAAPSMGSMAWSSISGVFDTSSKMLFFLSLFIFASLACRPSLFKKCMRRFNVAWWAYSFTLTFLALASTEYAKEMKGIGNSTGSIISLMLSALSILIFLCLILLTVLKFDKLLHRNDPSNVSFSNGRRSGSGSA